MNRLLSQVRRRGSAYEPKEWSRIPHESRARVSRDLLRSLRKDFTEGASMAAASNQQFIVVSPKITSPMVADATTQ